MLHEHLIILVCAPRSGSTLLQRMLGSHSAIHTHPEPHLLTGLNFLGYYDTVDKAPYDHINAAKAMREFCQDLPGGEHDYLKACRAYASSLYEGVLAPSGKQYFLDKTPEYATVLPFITKLYPKAKYIVLTRHPMAIWHSQAHSFFGGDYQAAHQTNPIVGRYVRAIGSFLQERTVPFVQVRYEDLVADPKGQSKRLLEHLGLPFESTVVEYGRAKHISKSYGDPINVDKHTRPVTDSIEKWAADLNARPNAFKLAQEIVRTLDSEHLNLWGYPRQDFFKSLDHQDAKVTQSKGLNTYRVQRKVLLHLRKNIHHNALGTIVKKVRYACDVLLRT